LSTLTTIITQLRSLEIVVPAYQTRLLDVSLVAQYTSLQRLRMPSGAATLSMTDIEFAWLAQLQRLTWLKIDETPPFDCIKTLRQLTNLRALMVNMHVIQDDSLAALLKLQQLELGVVHNIATFDIHLLTNLDSLSFSINARDPTVVFESLTRLTHLDMSAIGLAIDGESFERVAQLTNLQSLRVALRWFLDSHYFDAEDIAPFADLKHLTRLDLLHVIKTDTAADLAEQLPRLLQLRIDGQELLL
jgi:Leucine-rich repeat (LRR) protein